MTNPNDPIHPLPAEYAAGEIPLTKREYFAGLAMQGLIARGALSYDTAAIVSVQSVVFADALIAELSK